jgi:hypothetical protein
MDSPPITRREFLSSTATAAALVSAAPASLTQGQELSPAKPAARSIGIQVGAIFFVDEGVEPVLDLFQNKGAIDTIYLTTMPPRWPL